MWATQNTREDIFAGLFRRETFATSGPRVAVRFYEVWTGTNYCTGGFPGNVIADGGVPMGGTMAPPSGGATAPQFVVSALKDSDDLAEVDIVKGMYVGGTLTETVQRFTPNSPNTTWTNGSVCLGWTDPAFASTGPTSPSSSSSSCRSRGDQCARQTVLGAAPAGAHDRAEVVGHLPGQAPPLQPEA